MKKIEFYSHVFRDNTHVAQLQKGFTDGIYYYYKSVGGEWFAIHPDTGLSIARDWTRKKCAERAHEPNLKRQLDDVLKRRGAETVAAFRKLPRRDDPTEVL